MTKRVTRLDLVTGNFTLYKVTQTILGMGKILIICIKKKFNSLSFIPSAGRYLLPDKNWNDFVVLHQ